MEVMFAARNRRQSLIGSTVETSDSETRRQSVIGTTVGNPPEAMEPIVED